ncbi:Hypothetical predicted protein [Olea europaea subsp. europaea]|uniref:Uncharacterized protein n=1 Tax=Olea europaea subsp. europaea TaxID=158383 RepID=A0A8S0SC19_OLEEU|nr:Hypothetical predicted protein [Olea europaea subsp. europaea]
MTSASYLLSVPYLKISHVPRMNFCRLLAPYYQLLSCNHRETIKCMALLRGAFSLKNVHLGAPVDAQKHLSRSHACSSVKNAVQSVCVCLLAHMATSKYALATITGKPREVDQSALEKSQLAHFLPAYY